MTTPAILETVERLGFTLRSDGDAIRIEGPKDRLTPDIVSELKIGKPQILAWLRDLADAEQVPLTDMQTAYLLGREEALELGGVSSHVFHEFEGDWDIPRLEAAFQRVIDRHDALRMRIAGDGARVLPRGRVRAQIPVIDARGAEGEARRAAIREGMSHQVMHTARVPLVEMRALRTDRACLSSSAMTGLSSTGSACACSSANSSLSTERRPWTCRRWAQALPSCPGRCCPRRTRCPRSGRASIGKRRRPSCRPRRPCRWPPIPRGSTARQANAIPSAWPPPSGPPSARRRRRWGSAPRRRLARPSARFFRYGRGARISRSTRPSRTARRCIPTPSR
ncbi:MAG: hypothetical protein JKP98_16125 [Rhodobacteraceae bacterium]|nr:hypothetical protein [Paracoccaceae bacterium]